jgi:hypothetical protein
VGVRTRDVLVNVAIAGVASGLWGLTLAALSQTPATLYAIGTSLFLVPLALANVGYQLYERRRAHVVIQGEKIDYRDSNFHKISDHLDETGETIVNNDDWRLVFDVPLGQGRYIANIRFRKGSPNARGSIGFCVDNRRDPRACESIDISQCSHKKYSYVDHVFAHVGRRSVTFTLEPLDDDARQAQVVAFDRIEIYRTDAR